MGGAAKGTVEDLWSQQSHEGSIFLCEMSERRKAIIKEQTEIQRKRDRADDGRDLKGAFFPMHLQQQQRQQRAAMMIPRILKKLPMQPLTRKHHTSKLSSSEAESHSNC